MLDKKICFDVAKTALNYRDFRSQLKGKGCSLTILKEAWSVRKNTLIHRKSPKKTIDKQKISKKKVQIGKKEDLPPIVYERYLTPVTKDRDEKFVRQIEKALKQNFHLVLLLDLVQKKSASEKSKIITTNFEKIKTVVTDLLYGYDVKDIQLTKDSVSQSNLLSLSLKANRDWIGNKSTVLQSVRAIFDDPNFYILHGKNCNLGDDVNLKLRIKDLKKK